METSRSAQSVAVVLAVLGILLGMLAPAMMLAGYGPSQPVFLLFLALPLVAIPLAIGWLAPQVWWIAATGAPGLFLVAVAAIVTSRFPYSLSVQQSRIALLLPLTSTLFFAGLGWRLRQWASR